MEKDIFFSEHWPDANGNPAGGTSNGMGFTISWQNGPLGRDENRRQPNGAFVETIIYAAIDRLEYYQSTKFVCQENAEAIVYLQQALMALDRRTQGREDRKVEGTHVV